MRTTLLLMSLVTMAAGCVDVTSSAGADGHTKYTVECDGDSAGCFTKAGKLCPGGYYLDDRQSGTKELEHTAGVVAAPFTRLIIECK